PVKQQHIGFRDLLERLLPIEDLPSVDRLRVQRALRSGIAVEVERAALRAIDLLEQAGAIRRPPPEGRAGAGPAGRYQRRDQHDVITLQLPGPRVRDGVTIVAKSALPMQAPARLDQVRRLLRLDDPLTFADPRTGTTRAGLREQLDQAGRELLGSELVRYFARGEDEPDAQGERPLDASLAEDALKHHGMLFYCPDTERSSSLAQAARAAGTRSLVVGAVTGSDGKPLGLIEVHHPEPDPYRPTDLALVALLAEFAGGVLERAERIEKLVFVDPLTTAYNRSYYDLQIRNEI